MAIADVFLGALIPTTGLLAFYPLDNDDGNSVDDESGNGRHLTAELPGVDFPTITADQLNGRKAVVHADNVSPFQYIGALSVKDIFIIGKVDYTPTFPATGRGLLSGILAANFGLLLGENATVKWFNGAYAFDYYKSGTSFVATNMQAPFTYFEQMRITRAAAMGLDGIQFGRDREDAARVFTGKWADAIFYSAQLSNADAAKLKLYGDLKFGLWLLNGTTLTFPNPSLTGIAYRHFMAVPKPWGEYTNTHIYEDGGPSFNRTTDTPLREWNLEMDCPATSHAVSKAKTDIYDAFWDAVGIDRTFSFTDKYGTTHTGVRVKNYSRAHSDHRSWDQKVAFTLCLYP